MAVNAPYRNGVGEIVRVCRIITRLAAKFSPLWTRFLTTEDAQRLADLVQCAQTILNELERAEYRPDS